MNLEFRVTGNTKAAIKAAVLLTKSDAGQTIRQTAWPAWMRPRKIKLSHDELNTGGLYAYLGAMGLTEAEADPRAIDWDAYGEWTANDPKRGRCDVCGRGYVVGDANTCATCAMWAETVAA